MTGQGSDGLIRGLMSDFTNNLEAYGQFVSVELDTNVDFFPSGDSGIIVSTGTGFGEGGFGEGPFGGTVTYTLNYQLTQWTNIETP